MSDSEKTDELDNYGVWVKKSPKTVDSSDTPDSDFTMDMNLPDFSDLDVPEEPSSEGSVDVTDSFLSDLDTDLSDITAEAAEPVSQETESASTETSGTEDISLDEFISGGEFEDVAEGNRGYGQDEAPQETSSESSGAEESVSLDAFLDMDGVTATEKEQVSSPAPEQDDAPLDIDLSFDDSINTSMEAIPETDIATEEPSAETTDISMEGTESIDLSEFGFDDAGSESSPASEPAAQETAPAEESVSSDNFDDMFNSVSEDTAIDASAFFDEPAGETAAPNPAPAEENASTSEEVDLSDFGFDDSSLASQGEVKDETRSVAPTAVDYEMNVMADDDLPAEPQPSVTEASETPAAEMPVSETPIIEMSAESADEAKDDIVFDDMVIIDETPNADETPAAELPAETEEAFGDIPVVNEIELGEPIIEETAVFDDIPVTEEESIPEDEPVIEPQLPDIPLPDEPVIEESFAITETAADVPETAVPETIAVEETIVPEAPFTEEPVAEMTVPETSFTEEPVVEETVAETTFAEEPVTEEPVIEETVVPEVPVTDSPAAEPAQPASADSINTPAATAILSQIVGELSSLKNEIAGLKNDFEEMKNRDIAPAGIPESKESNESTGFFDDTGEDDTIALSTDELANIMDTADFETEVAEEAETAVIPEQTEEKTEAEDIDFSMPETTDEENTLDGEETLSTNELENIVNTASFETEHAEEEPADSTEPAEEETAEESIDFAVPETAEEENALDGEETLSTDELANIMNTADFATEQAEESAATQESAEETVATEEPVIEEPVDAASNDDFNFDAIESENTLPDEISVPKAEDTEATESEAVASEEETISEDSLSFLSTEAKSDEVSAEEPPEETPVEPEAISMALDNAEPIIDEEPAPMPQENLSGDLKSEIKSVLSYMDKLLENLPEDKIAEFAQSEQFETYKKLFKELGLA